MLDYASPQLATLNITEINSARPLIVYNLSSALGGSLNGLGAIAL